MKCPYCKEEIETAKVCPICGENIPFIFRFINILNCHKKPIIMAISAVILVYLLICGGTKAYNSISKQMNNPADKNVIENVTIPIYEQKAELKKANSTLNMALALDYALEGEFCNTTYTLKKAFNRRLNIKGIYDDGFITADDMKYTFIPLNKTCRLAPNIENVGEENACAKIIIDINGDIEPNQYLNDQFELYLYPDQVLPKYGSETAKLLNEE